MALANVMDDRITPDFLDEILNKYKDSYDLLADHKKIIINKISYCDQEISDFYHLIEFGKFPAHVLAQIHKKYSKILKERRYLKDILMCLNTIENEIKKHGFDIDLSEFPTYIRTYTPRRLTDIFIEYKRYMPRKHRIDLEILTEIEQ